MKIGLTAILVSVVGILATGAFPAPSAKAESEEVASYIVTDAATGHMLSSASPGKKLQIGSLTNIATAMVVLDWADRSKLDLGTLVTVPSGVDTVGGANPVGFQAGDQVSLRDLLYAAMLQSDNAAAYTLAEHVGRDLGGGSVEETPMVVFVAQMNALARKLGMLHTKFLNPYGLDTVEHPYSTARDLAALTAYAMQRSAFCFLVSQKERRITRHLAAAPAPVPVAAGTPPVATPSAGPVAEYNLLNTNELLGTSAIDGVKTGKTALAGECVVISAARPPDSTQNPDGSVTVVPRRLIVVVLGAPRDRFGVAARVLNEGWNLYDAWAAAGRPISK